MQPTAETPTAQPLDLQLAPSLPGEADIVVPLLDEAVAELNRIYVTKGLETARDIGEYVLEAFFAGDTANFRQRGNGHLTFRELGKREDLKVGWLFIWNAVAVVEQFGHLPRDVAEALPLSHHKLLLTVKDDNKKRELAEAALQQNLGKREFEARVKAARGPDAASKAGRPPLPGFAKAVTGLRKVVKTATEEPIEAEAFAHLTVDEARALADELDAGIEALTTVAAQVRAVLAAGLFPRGNEAGLLDLTD